MSREENSRACPRRSQHAITRGKSRRKMHVVVPRLFLLVRLLVLLIVLCRIVVRIRLTLRRFLNSVSGGVGVEGGHEGEVGRGLGDKVTQRGSSPSFMIGIVVDVSEATRRCGGRRRFGTGRRFLGVGDDEGPEKEDDLVESNHGDLLAKSQVDWRCSWSLREEESQ
jgi:hypothetical protein